MNSAIKITALSFAFILSLSFSIDNKLSENEAMKIFVDLKEWVASLETMEFTLTNYERVNNQMMEGTQKVSLVTNPYKCHILMINPGDGEELIYAGELYNNMAIYEPNGFPYVQLELDPYDFLMRKNNHHNITELGFKNMFDIIEFHMNSSPYKLKGGVIILNQKEYYKIEIDFVDFEMNTVTIKKTESLSTFAGRLRLNDFMISTLNNRDVWDEVELGENLIIPNTYAKKIDLLVEKETGLLFSQIVYDDKGLYEKYEFTDLKVNIEIPQNRFDEEMLGKE